jgi:hypothetical protein
MTQIYIPNHFVLKIAIGHLSDRIRGHKMVLEEELFYDRGTITQVSEK